MDDSLKFDPTKNCWTCKYFSTRNQAPIGSGSSEYTCYLHGATRKRSCGSGMGCCDCHERRPDDV